MEGGGGSVAEDVVRLPFAWVRGRRLMEEELVGDLMALAGGSRLDS